MVKKYLGTIKWVTKFTILSSLGILYFIKATELINYNRDVLLKELNEQSHYGVKKQTRRNTQRVDQLFAEIEKRGSTQPALQSKIGRLRKLTHGQQQLLQLYNLDTSVELIESNKIEEVEKGFEAYFSSIAQLCDTSAQFQYYRNTIFQDLYDWKTKFGKQRNDVTNGAISLKLQTNLLALENELLSQLGQQIELKAKYYIY